MKLKLFPLRLVAYPSKIVPLHIFEDRYKLLINECISTNSEFGIIYQNDKMLANVGCTVKVHKVLKRYKDGRMDILTKGNSLFKLIDKQIEHEIVTAKIELFSQSADDLAPFEKLRDKYLQVLMSIGVSENLDRHLLKSSSFELLEYIDLMPELELEIISIGSEQKRIEVLDNLYSELLSKLNASKKRNSLLN